MSLNPIFTDDEVKELYAHENWDLCSPYILSFVDRLTQAYQAKLAEQEPVATIQIDSVSGVDITYHKFQGLFDGMRLYAHPQAEIQKPLTPRNAAEMRGFIGMHFGSLRYANPETEEPSDDDWYTLSIHDLLSAFSWAGHYDPDDRMPIVDRSVSNKDNKNPCASESAESEKQDPITDIEGMMIWCACGDGYPDCSYEAGFIHGRGECENCNAADQSSILAEGQAKIMAGATRLGDYRIMAARGTATENDVAEAYKALELRVRAELVIARENASESPEDWQMVPKRPPEDMALGFWKVDKSIDGGKFRDAYASMLEAAPKYMGDSNE